MLSLRGNFICQHVSAGQNDCGYEMRIVADSLLELIFEMSEESSQWQRGQGEVQ